MRFGLKNAMRSFQSFMNYTLVVVLDRYVIVYLNDILFHSDILDDDQMQVRSVLEALLRATLHLKPENRKFHKEEVICLG